MCPMQCRTNGIRINDTPKYHSKEVDKSTHVFNWKIRLMKKVVESQVTFHYKNLQRRRGRII